MLRLSWRRALAKLAFAAWLLASSASAAASPTVPANDSFFRCDRALSASAAFSRSDASLDLYNGLLFAGAAGATVIAGRPTRTWSRVNGFDDGIRNGLRLDASGDREKADTASDVILGLSLAAMPFLSIGAQFGRTHDCVETWDMLTDVVETFGLTLFLSESIKLASGRARPSTRECDGIRSSDAICSGRDRYKSFVSGHASLAAAGAGLTCSFAIKREAWGASPMAKAAPCTLGVVAALSAGALRILADRHWGSDVILGFGLGALVGYFDTWGPFDLLKFETRDSSGDVSAKGLILPEVSGGRFGARVMMVF